MSTDVDLDEFFRLLAREAPDAIVYSDAEGVIRFWNTGAERIFGFSGAEALGRSLDIIIPENLRKRHWDGYAETMRTGKTRYGAGDVLAVPALRKDGTRVSIEFTILALHDEDRRLVGVAAILRDVTKRFEEIKALRKQLAQQPHPILTRLAAAVARNGYAFVGAHEMHAILREAGLRDWEVFARSWDGLGVDAHMADGGRYRRRRYAAFSVSANGIVHKPHQPHFQSRDYNPLNGGIERWFEPVTNAAATHPALNAILRVCHLLFDVLTPADVRPSSWRVEVHQFRIEARSGQEGHPTPEGMHRDGVDWVLVLMVARKNIASGTTTIYDLAKRPLGSFTLATPFDAAFVDDHRVYHGVTPVEPADPSDSAYRDVLVVTFRRDEG